MFGLVAVDANDGLDIHIRIDEQGARACREMATVFLYTQPIWIQGPQFGDVPPPGFARRLLPSLVSVEDDLGIGEA